MQGTPYESANSPRRYCAPKYRPWPNQKQVEQDLLLCQSMIALFSDDFLKTQIAIRGGTPLHKGTPPDLEHPQ
jgi:hypothetical protein